MANNSTLILAAKSIDTIDSKASAEIIELMRELNKTRNTTFIIVTHDPDIARATDKAIYIIDGKIKEQI